MLQVSPHCLQFEKQQSTIQLVNPLDVQFVVRVRSTNTTAYKYDTNEFVVKPRGQVDFPVTIEIGRQVEVQDSFRVLYFKDEQNQKYAQYVAQGNQPTEVVIKVLLKKHVNMKGEYDSLNITQQLYQAELLDQELQQKKIKLQQQLADIQQQCLAQQKTKSQVEQQLVKIEQQMKEFGRSNGLQKIANSQSAKNGAFLALIFALSFLVAFKW
ncbi:Major_sperm protein (MSP) domain [Hexamita inflata]|uniref:Major sperm protein (MSP) domain n=1 Tax=Hexamita inflata TaxID=28002 RepID=A0AA86U9N1_9EUKA|nr:Major sperm protein (MSP) domain [Hexamita inflata]